MPRLTTLFAVLIAAAGMDAREDDGPPLADQPEKKATPNPKAGPPAGDEEVDVQKTAERIVENAQKAGDRLKDKDPGTGTRKLQQTILKDIDALLKKAQEPPPPPMSDMPPPMPPMTPPPPSGMPPPKSDMPMPTGGSGMPPPQSPMPKGGSGGGTMSKRDGGHSGGNGAGRRSRRDRRPGAAGLMNTTPATAKKGHGDMNRLPTRPEPQGRRDEEPAGARAGEKFGKLSPRRSDDKLADLYKDVWGNLPDRMRQELDLYYREQFMPRYSALLRQYYAALAEQRKKGTEDRR